MGGPYNPRKVTSGIKEETVGLNRLRIRIKSSKSLKLNKIILDRFYSQKSPKLTLNYKKLTFTFLNVSSTKYLILKAWLLSSCLQFVNSLQVSIGIFCFSCRWYPQKRSIKPSKPVTVLSCLYLLLFYDKMKKKTAMFLLAALLYLLEDKRICLISVLPTYNGTIDKYKKNTFYLLRLLKIRE